MAKLSKKIPKRATNDKLKLKRARSYSKGQNDKTERKLSQAAREMKNRERGYTGKDLDKAARKAFGQGYRAHKRLQQNGTLEFQTMTDGPLHKPYIVVIGVSSLA